MAKYDLVRFRHMQMWYVPHDLCSAVYSYDTHIGYVYWKKGEFKTWGYGTYSRTTSKQITIFCNHFKLKRIDISKEDYL